MILFWTAAYSGSVYFFFFSTNPQETWLHQAQVSRPWLPFYFRIHPTVFSSLECNILNANFKNASSKIIILNLSGNKNSEIMAGKPKLHYTKGRGKMESIRWLLAAAGVEVCIFFTK